MKVLALDTSTLTGSIAIVDIAGDSPRELGSALDESGNHSQRMIEHVDTVLNKAALSMHDIDAICVGIGPGSFTGLRIGLATAKGLALATDTPLWPVSSLAALAFTAPEAPLIIAAADARRGEIFLGGFVREGGALRAVAEERVLPPSEFAEAVAGIASKVSATELSIVGEAASLYPTEVASAGEIAKDCPKTPMAIGVAGVAKHSAREDQRLLAAPAYVRPSEAEIRFPSGNPGGTFASFAKKPSA